jgi:hypothetical protein
MFGQMTKTVFETSTDMAKIDHTVARARDYIASAKSFLTVFEDSPTNMPFRALPITW